MGKIIAFIFFAMWTFQLLGRAANAFTRWQQQRSQFGNTEEGEWEVIDPAERSDGTPVQAALSSIEKARRVFNGRMRNQNGTLDNRANRIGILVLLGATALALLILVPTLIVILQ